MLSDAHIPTDIRNLRACLVCSLVKSAEQFERQGCDNCEAMLGLKDNAEKVEECTSSNFDGLIAVADPNDSWVCKWQGIKARKPGLYAVSVSGSLSREVIGDLKAQGFRYRPEMRDRSVAQ